MRHRSCHKTCVQQIGVRAIDREADRAANCSHRVETW